MNEAEANLKELISVCNAGAVQSIKNARQCKSFRLGMVIFCGAILSIPIDCQIAAREFWTAAFTFFFMVALMIWNHQAWTGLLNKCRERKLYWASEKLRWSRELEQWKGFKS